MNRRELLKGVVAVTGVTIMAKLQVKPQREPLNPLERPKSGERYEMVIERLYDKVEELQTEMVKR